MKIKHSPKIIAQLKQINLLMDQRIAQLKDADSLRWWELSLKDEMYIFLCKKYAEIKALETNLVIEVSEEEKKNLLIKLTQISDEVIKIKK